MDVSIMFCCFFRWLVIRQIYIVGCEGCVGRAVSVLWMEAVNLFFFFFEVFQER